MKALIRRGLASARVRILLTLFLVLAFMAILTTVLLREVLAARASERVEGALTQEVAEFRTLVDVGIDPRSRRPFGRDVGRMFDVFLERNVPSAGEAIFTFLPGGPHKRSPTSDALGEFVVERLLALGQDVDDTQRGEIRAEGIKVRYLAVPVIAEGAARGVFLIAGNLRAEEAEANDAADVAGYVAGVALVLATLLGLVVTGRTLRPLREIAGTAQRISETDLTRRIPVQGDDEIGKLGRTFNQMLDRLEHAFDSQRSLVSDVGHELRTPITIIRGHLDLLPDDPDDRDETIALVQDELDRMSRLVNDLLTLAKAERSDFLHPELLDLDDLTAELFAKARGLGDHDWRLTSTGAGTLVADRQRLTQAVMNLADNAARYTPPGAVIELATRMAGRDARLSISDHGPGIDPKDQERLFGRFARGADAPSGEGSGLGLAIVQVIAEAHRGRVELHSVPPHGATFTVVVPAEPIPQTEPVEALT